VDAGNSAPAWLSGHGPGRFWESCHGMSELQRHFGPSIHGAFSAVWTRNRQFGRPFCRFEAIFGEIVGWVLCPGHEPGGRWNPSSVWASGSGRDLGGKGKQTRSLARTSDPRELCRRCRAGRLAPGGDPLVCVGRGHEQGQAESQRPAGAPPSTGMGPAKDARRLPLPPGKDSTPTTSERRTTMKIQAGVKAGIGANISPRG